MIIVFWCSQKNKRFCKRLEVYEQILVNKLSSDEPIQYLDGWPLRNWTYCKKTEVCEPY